jgi:Ca-activated chloride channel homolog
MKKRFEVGLLAVCLLAFAASAQDRTRPPQPGFRVEAEAVRVPVVVVDKDGNLYTQLTRENFQILEDGRPQEITSFEASESGTTIVLVLEFSQVVHYIRGEVLRPAGVFVSHIMKQDDFAAIISFDTRPRILSDFTKNRQQLMSAVSDLMRSPPGFRDSSLFDAVAFAVDGGTLDLVEYRGLREIEGRTGVILVATGINTFSRRSLGDTRRIVANAGVPIYAIGVGELSFIRAEPYLSGLQRLTFLQGQNQLRTFANESGGRFYNIRFPGQVSGVLDSISKMLRFQYTLAYTPSDPGRDGKRREIEVLVDIDGDGTPDNDRLDLSYRRYYYEPDRRSE